MGSNIHCEIWWLCIFDLTFSSLSRQFFFHFLKYHFRIPVIVDNYRHFNNWYALLKFFFEVIQIFLLYKFYSNFSCFTIASTFNWFVDSFWLKSSIDMLFANNWEWVITPWTEWIHFLCILYSARPSQQVLGSQSLFSHDILSLSWVSSAYVPFLFPLICTSPLILS